MLVIDYKEKLKGFNATPKYQNEMNFLGLLLDLKKGQKVLDYGCGLGTAMRFLSAKYQVEAFGFDVINYYEGDPFYFREYLYFELNAIFFMHSLAHIKNPPLTQLKNKFLLEDGKIVVITPNKAWLDLQDKSKYIPDPTVVKHYYLDELQQLFIEAGFKIGASGEFGTYPKNGERLFIVAYK